MIRLGKIPPDIYYNYALLCMKTGDKDKAETIFKKVIQLDPKNGSAHKDLGVVYLSQRLFDYAKDEFLTAFELEPENPSVVFELANFYQVMNDYKTAAGYYEKAFELDKNSMDISIFRALNYLKMNEIDKSLELFLEAMKKFPSQYLILFNLLPKRELRCC